MNILGYTLVNPEKVNRAIYGTVGRNGTLTGGVGESSVAEKPEAVLAEYDRLGGLVRKGKYPVKMGAFYDFEKHSPRAKKDFKVLLTFRNIETGEVMEVPEDEELPIEARAAAASEDRAVAKMKAKAEKKGKKADEEYADEGEADEA